MDEAIDERFKRMEDENCRQNHRVEMLEKNVEAVQSLALSVQKLAVNMDNMISEQRKQGDRLCALEKEPADKWNNMTRTIFNTILGAVIGVALTGIIWSVAQTMR